MNQIFNHAPTHELQARDAAHHDNTELLNQRLTQAGVRLAAALNKAYAAR